MKFFCLFICLVLTSPIFSQQDLKYQVRINVIPVKSFRYGGAVRVGIQTTGGKYNIGMDLMRYWVDGQTNITYLKDPVLRRINTTTFIFAHGIAFNVSRTYRFNKNNNFWILGVQAFSGYSRQVSVKNRQKLDSTSNGDPVWISQESNSIGEYHVNGPKLSLAGSVFLRLQIEISRRFTFTPELQVPVTINNYIGGDIKLDLSPGFNFCLGYRFGAYKG